jgi:hypothetical protein
LALHRLDKDIDIAQMKLNKKKQAAKGLSSEELALREFK